MATKREVMAAGIPARLSHMLASDTPHVLAPLGMNQASAALVETNFQVLFGQVGTAVRLKPASGQFLHFLFNGNFYTVEVYPDGDEYINDIPPGQPFLLEAFMTGVFAPARQQWIAGQLSGSGAGGTAPIEVPGPFGVGVSPPADADQPQLFAERLALAWSPGVAGGEGARIYFNAYADPTHAVRYLADGPAFIMVCRETDPSGIEFSSAPPGTAGALVQFTLLARIATPGIFQAGALPSPADAGASQIFTDRLALRWSPGAAGGSGARIFFNTYLDTANTPHYYADGPGFTLRCNDVTQDFEFDVAPVGTAGAPVTIFNVVARIGQAAQTSPGQTNLTLITNSGGTTTLQPVLVGPANSGPGGTGRALYVAT